MESHLIIKYKPNRKFAKCRNNTVGRPAALDLQLRHGHGYKFLELLMLFCRHQTISDGQVAKHGKFIVFCPFLFQHFSKTQTALTHKHQNFAASLRTNNVMKRSLAAALVLSMS